jgi:hypothetical protein
MNQDHIDAIENLCNTLMGCPAEVIEEVLEQIKEETRLHLLSLREG